MDLNVFIFVFELYLTVFDMYLDSISWNAHTHDRSRTRVRTNVYLRVFYLYSTVFCVYSDGIRHTLARTPDLTVHMHAQKRMRI